jgi:hypothetical protein
MGSQKGRFTKDAVSTVRITLGALLLLLAAKGLLAGDRSGWDSVWDGLLFGASVPVLVSGVTSVSRGRGGCSCSDEREPGARRG